MTTGRELAQKALREPMRSIGWQPRAAGWFTQRIADGFLGAIEIDAASKHSKPGTATITLRVGIRDEVGEAVVSRLCDAKDRGYRQLTVDTFIGYVMTGSQMQKWLITPDNADMIASELTAAVEEFAEPYLRKLASDQAALLDGVWSARNLGQPWGICRVVVYRARYQGRDFALAYLDEQVAALEARASSHVFVVRGMAERARDWLALPDSAADVADRRPG